MGFFKKVKQAVIVDRLAEEKLYEQVLHEVESGIRRDGLWAKAFQKSHGDEQKAKALYFKYRIQALRDEAEISAAIATNPSPKVVGLNEQEANQEPVLIKPDDSSSTEFCMNDCQSEHKENQNGTVHGKKFSKKLDKNPKEKGPHYFDGIKNGGNVTDDRFGIWAIILVVFFCVASCIVVLLS